AGLPGRSRDGLEGLAHDRPQPLELLEVGGHALGDPVQKRIDVALVVASEREAELHLLYLFRRDPGAGRRGIVRSLLPTHAVVPLRQQLSAARRTARITNAMRMERSSPTPPARIGGIRAPRGRRSGSGGAPGESQ